MSGASFGDDRGHSDATATHNRAASRLRGRQRGGGLPTAGSGRGLRLRSGHAGTLRLSAPRQARQGRGASVPRRRDGHLAQADGASGPAVAGDRGGPGSARRRSRPPVRAQVRGGGTSGCWRKSTRPSVRCPGWPRGSPAAAVRGVRRGAVRAPRDDLERARRTTCAAPPRTARSAPCGRGRGRRPQPSACAKPRSPRGGRATCASTPCTRATAMA